MTAFLGASPVSNYQIVSCFSVSAAVDPSVIPRVMAVFAQLGFVPDKWYSTIDGLDGDKLIIDIQMGGLNGSQAEHLAQSIRQIVQVDTVLTSEKRPLATLAHD